jgi:hypothetical protein
MVTLDSRLGKEREGQIIIETVIFDNHNSKAYKLRSAVKGKAARSELPFRITVRTLTLASAKAFVVLQ